MDYVWSPGGMGLGKCAVAVIRGRFGEAVGNKTMSVTVYLHLGHSYNSRRAASSRQDHRSRSDWPIAAIRSRRGTQHCGSAKLPFARVAKAGRSQRFAKRPY